MEGRLLSHSQASTSAPCPEPLPRRATRAAYNAAWPPARPRAEAPRSDRRQLRVAATIAAPAKPAPGKRAEGHSALLQGLGRLGDVAPSHMPWLLRLAHIRHALAEPSCVQQLAPMRLENWLAVFQVCSHKRGMAPTRSSLWLDAGRNLRAATQTAQWRTAHGAC